MNNQQFLEIFNLGTADEIRSAIQNCVDVNAKDENRDLPLILAVKNNGKVEIIQTLIEEKIKPTTLCTKDSTGIALMETIKPEDLEAFNVLLEACPRN